MRVGKDGHASQWEPLVISLSGCKTRDFNYKTHLVTSLHEVELLAPANIHTRFQSNREITIASSTFNYKFISSELFARKNKTKECISKSSTSSVGSCKIIILREIKYKKKYKTFSIAAYGSS